MKTFIANLKHLFSADLKADRDRGADVAADIRGDVRTEIEALQTRVRDLEKQVKTQSSLTLKEVKKGLHK